MTHVGEEHRASQNFVFVYPLGYGRGSLRLSDRLPDRAANHRRESYIAHKRTNPTIQFQQSLAYSEPAV
jgi:hypothetical protein